MSRSPAVVRPEYSCVHCQTMNWCDRAAYRQCGTAHPRGAPRAPGATSRRPPLGAPATRQEAASPIKPGLQAETFRRAAADMRKAGAPPNVIEPVLAAEREARQRQTEAKASSKLEAARHAANHAQTAVDSAEAAVAAAEEAFANARQRLDRCKQRHRERTAAIQAEEDLLAASKPAEIVAADVASKALKLLEWFQDKIP